MLYFFKESKWYQWLIWVFITSVTLLVIYTPERYLIKELAKYSVQIMLVCLFLSMAFLMWRDEKSMWISLCCCGLLCFNLRTREPFYPMRYGDIFKIAHINLSDGSDYEATINAILKSDAQVIAFQDLDPNWDFILKQKLKKTYPYELSIVSLGVYNPAVYSKLPFASIDTFHYKDAPNIYGAVKMPSGTVNFISSVTTPPIDLNAYKEIQNHLLKIGNFARNLNAPVLVLGDYNVVTFSPEMNILRGSGGLIDSRRDVYPVGRSPYDHILYSEHLECTDFTNLKEANGSKIGILGTYQFNRTYENTHSKKN